MVYKWRDGSRFSGPAQNVGERLEQIRARNDGKLEPGTMIADGRSPKSPLHPHFTWDEAEAANKCRVEEAREILRCIVTIEESPAGPQKETIAYLAVGTSKEGSCYRTTADVLSDEELTAQVLAEALAQLRGWRRRYAQLKQLASIFEAIDRLDVDNPA